MSTDMRPIEPEELEAFTEAESAAFGFQPDADFLERSRAVGELDRSLAVFDGEEIVGTAGVFSFNLTVPGGALPTAGVTWVSVKPTHRRRGILSGMMERQLGDVRDRGEPLAALWASESLIYDRFGYGVAAEGAELSIDRAHTAFAGDNPSCANTRIVSREEALQSWPAVYKKVLPAQPGMYSRSESWWQHHALRASAGKSGRSSGSFYVQYEEDGEPQGYARYRIRQGEAAGWPTATLMVLELMAATDSAYKGLWSYLFGVDLIGEIEAYHRRVDEPLVWMLADPRRLVRRTLDTLWLRIIAVEAALEGRRYAADGKFVLEVQDRVCLWNQGRYELEGGSGGARCKRTGAEPDVVLSAADLAAAYLGGVRLQSLRRAGRVSGDAEALRLADAMFAWDPLPWCPEVF